MAILEGTLRSSQDDNLSIEPLGLMAGLVFCITNEDHLIILFRPASGTSWAYGSGETSVLISGSGTCRKVL